MYENKQLSGQGGPARPPFTQNAKIRKGRAKPQTNTNRNTLFTIYTRC